MMDAPTLTYRPAIWAILLTASSASPQDSEFAERFQALNAATVWRQTGQTTLGFDTFHPQGMTRVRDDWFISSVEVVDRVKGEGRAHLFRVLRDGRLFGKLDLTDGVRYHPGGIDFDGARIWVSVAEYRPDSSSVVYTIDPIRMRAEELFSFADHLGAIVHDVDRGTLLAVSWGSRRFYRWRTEVSEGGVLKVMGVDAPEMMPNPAHYVDFQDAQWIRGTGLVLFGGLKRYRSTGTLEGDSFALSGLELFDSTTLSPEHQVPVPLWDDGGRPMLQNPFFAETIDTGLRFYFMPADNASTIYEYTVEP